MIFTKKIINLFSDPNLKGETLNYYKQKTNILLRTQMRGLSTERKKAKDIEEFLNAVKNHEYKKNKLKNIIEESLFIELTKDLPENLFRQRHSKADLKKDFDDIFEKELNDFLNKMTIKEKNFLGGTKTGTTLIKNDNFSRIAELAATGIKDSLGENIVKEVKSLSSEIFKIPEAREQKTDFGVNINIETQVQDKYKKVIELFNNKNFSLKNYFAEEDKSITIHLGNTNPLKSITGSLIDLGEPEAVALKAFYAGTAVYYRENGSIMGEELAACIFALRSYYEVTGAGLKLKGKPVSKVDFVIVNNPNGKIRVISSKELVLHILLNKNRNNKKHNPFRDVSATIPINEIDSNKWISMDNYV